MQFWDYRKEDGFEERSKAFAEIQAMEGSSERSDAYERLKQSGLLPDDRMFVGRQMNEDVGLFINDREGRPRIKIYIDSSNNPRVEILDEDGELVPVN